MEATQHYPELCKCCIMMRVLPFTGINIGISLFPRVAIIQTPLTVASRSSMKLEVVEAH